MLLLMPMIGYELEAMSISFSKALGSDRAMIPREARHRLLTACLIQSLVLLKEP